MKKIKKIVEESMQGINFDGVRVLVKESCGICSVQDTVEALQRQKEIESECEGE